MSKVVILGAGSSKDCGLPLGNEVFEYFNHNDGPHWYDFMKKIFPQHTISVTKYPTFEVVLSLIESWIENKQTIGHYDLENIRRSLIESFIKIFKSICPWIDFKLEDNDGLMPEADVMHENFERYQKFFNQLMNKDGDTTFISMNYDVLLDNVLFKMGNFTYGFDIYDLANQNERCRESGVLLLKPHGSINLVRCRKCRKNFTFITSSMGLASSHTCEHCGGRLEILIIPPTFYKSIKDVKDEPYTAIHKKISEEISKADEILIIGYSLPDYDLNILQAFKEGMVKNENESRLKIEIVDKIDKIEEQLKIKNKYGSIFNRTEVEITCHFEGFKKYTDDSLRQGGN